MVHRHIGQRLWKAEVILSMCCGGLWRPGGDGLLLLLLSEEAGCPTRRGRGREAKVTVPPPPPPPPLSALTLVFAEVFHYLPSSSHVPLLKYLLTEAQPPSQIGSALPKGRSDLDPGQLLEASQAATPVAPLVLPNPATHKHRTTALAMSTPLKSS